LREANGDREGKKKMKPDLLDRLLFWLIMAACYAALY